MTSDYAGAAYLDARSTPEPMSGCVLWVRSINASGYGSIKRDGFWLAHRYSYAVEFGDFDRSLCVLHRCDNSACINPRHLFLGTVEDNNNDKIRKGRQFVPRGDKNPRAKLSREQRDDARRLAELGETHDAIASLLGVSSATISFLLRGATWACDGAEPKNRRTHRRLSLEAAKGIHALHGTGSTEKEIAIMHGVTIKAIRRILRGKTWAAAAKQGEA